MELEQAIRISKILCQADEGRLPMILSVLEKAGVNINGLEELEEWKALTSQGYLIDVDEFVDGLKTAFSGDEKRITIPVRQFNAYCAERKLKPLLVKRLLAKRLLAKHGYLTPTYKGEKRMYTTTVWMDNAPVRCVAVWKTRQDSKSDEYGTDKEG